MRSSSSPRRNIKRFDVLQRHEMTTCIITTTVFVHMRECFCACVQGWMDLISSHFVMCWWLEEVICRGRGGVEGQIEWAVTLIDCSKSCIHTHGFILYICVWRDLLFCLDCPLLSHRVRQRDIEKKPCKIICWIHFYRSKLLFSRWPKL